VCAFALGLFLAASTMNFGDWAGALQNLVAIAAIAGGAIWGYYKFVRGRTFHRRAEVDVDASLLASDEASAIRAKITLENTGGANIPLRAKAVKVLSYTHRDVDENGRPVWRDVAIAPIFQDHGWLESQETITDEVLVPLLGEKDQPANVLAFRVTCLVYEERRRQRRGKKQADEDSRESDETSIVWTTNAIVPARLAPPDPKGAGRAG
jgi:hypothetical protein